MPASSRVLPVEAEAGDLAAGELGPSRRKASGSWSMTATVWPTSSRLAGDGGADASAAHHDHVHVIRGLSRRRRPPARIGAKLHPGRGPGAPARVARERGAPTRRAPAPRLRTIAPCRLSDLGLPKRLVLGRPVRSDRLGETLLPKRLALPIFASDALSSVAYATQEILIVLTLGGLAYLYLAPWVAAGVVVLLLTVVLSYRQVVHAYPSGGGDYEVATKNHRRSSPALVVASALLVDYVLTVAVSVASGVDNIISAFPSLNPHRVRSRSAFVVLLAAVNLRGVRESGTAFAIPTYLFTAGMVVMIVTGCPAASSATPPRRRERALRHHPRARAANLTGLALLFFALRAFSSGCTALTGVEAIANGVPAFRPPKSRNAADHAGAAGRLAITMFAGITALALIAHVRYVDRAHLRPASASPRLRDRAAAHGHRPDRRGHVRRHHSIGFFYIQAATALILMLAANTAFNGFPLLGSVLAQDRYLPRQLHTRGDRLVFSNGILLLAGFADAADLRLRGRRDPADPALHHRRVHLVHARPVRHGAALEPRCCGTERDPNVRRRMQPLAGDQRASAASLTGVVLVIVLITKFTHGA